MAPTRLAGTVLAPIASGLPAFCTNLSLTRKPKWRWTGPNATIYHPYVQSVRINQQWQRTMEMIASDMEQR
jgi:hypothetical protein